jgi:hypothetical protein
MRSLLGIPLACVVLLAATALVATPAASACSLSTTGSPHTTTIERTESAGGHSVTVGVILTQDQYQGIGEPCQAIAQVESLPPTNAQPILVVS